MRSRTVAVFALAAAVAGCATPAPVPDRAAAPQPGVAATARVVRVVDGDTVHVQPTHGAEITVRLLGIDTPETVKPGFTVGCGGPAASAHAHTVLDGATVTVTTDPTQDTTDSYGRTLAYLTLPDGTDYSITTVQAGYARAYTYHHHPVAKAAAIAAAQHTAQATHTGIWGPPCDGHTDSTPR